VRLLIWLLIIIFLTACVPSDLEREAEIEKADWVDLSLRTKAEAITTQPWQSVIIIEEKLGTIAPLFTKIGGYETVSKSTSQWILKAPDSEAGYIHLIENKYAIGPMRPVNSRAWDKGCFYSIMMRAKDTQSIIDDAKALGWTPLTDIAYLEFGPSKLNIIVLTHKSGVRVQLYERLTTALPEGFPAFERLSQPFNIMQMVEDRDVSYDFFQQKLGFDTFFYGPPFAPAKPSVMPLGIPVELTPKTPYKTGIMTPKTGLEWGRVEMIDVENMPGDNLSQRCTKDYSGIYGVSFPVTNIERVRKQLTSRNVPIVLDKQSALWIKTPDGSNIEFFQK